MPLAWNELLGRSARRRKCTLTTLRAVRRLISARRGGKAAFVLLTNAEFDDALRSAGVRDVGVTFARTHPPELGGLMVVIMGTRFHQVLRDADVTLLRPNNQAHLRERSVAK